MNVRDEFEIRKIENDLFPNYCNLIISKKLINELNKIDNVHYNLFEYTLNIKDFLKNDLDDRLTIEYGDLYNFIEPIYSEVTDALEQFDGYTTNNKEIQEELLKKWKTFDIESVNMYTQETLEEFFTTALAISSGIRNYFLKRDLTNECKNLLSEIKEVCTSEEYNYFSAFLKNNNYDVDNMKKVVDLLHKKIKDDWISKMSDIDEYKVGDDFSFLCHSVRSSQWEGDFKTPYVSTSLLTQEMWDTFNRPYGLIFDPKDIAAASYYDLYTINARETGDLFFNTSIPPMMTKKNIEDKCKKLKEETGNKIYSEIVIKGFNPKAIFAITDGTELDESYIGALELKERFPDLKVIELVKSYFCSKEEQFVIFKQIISNLSQITGLEPVDMNFYIDMFAHFLINKKNGTYDKGLLIEQYKTITTKNKNNY